MADIQQNNMQQAVETHQNVNQPKPAATNNNEVWCVDPMIVDYNPGKRTRQEIFKNKTRGILDADKFEAIVKETPAL